MARQLIANQSTAVRFRFAPPRLLARLAWRNVRRNWRHSFSTLLAISAGFIAVGLFDGFLNDIAWQNEDGFETRGMVGQVIVQHKDAQHHLIEDPFAFALNKTEQNFLEKYLPTAENFRARVRFLDVKGLVTNGHNSSVFMGHGHDVDAGAMVRGERWSWNTLAGKPLNLTNLHAPVILGIGMGELMECERASKELPLKKGGGYEPGERAFACSSPSLQLSTSTEAAQINALDVEVSGLIDAGFREADKHFISMPIEMAQELLDTDKVTLYGVHLQNKNQAKSFVAALRDAAKQAGLELDVMPWREHLIASSINGGLEILNVFRNLFMIVVVTIAVMSVTNTMMKSVSERTREIGMLRSVGFKRRDIQMLFLWEGFFLSLIACVVGLLGTIGIALLISSLGLTFRAGILSMPIPLQVAAAPKAWLISGICLSGLAAGAAWVCARRASKMRVADALKHI